jgi:hypothetical protein
MKFFLTVSTLASNNDFLTPSKDGLRKLTATCTVATVVTDCPSEWYSAPVCKMVDGTFQCMEDQLQILQATNGDTCETDTECPDNYVCVDTICRCPMNTHRLCGDSRCLSIATDPLCDGSNGQQILPATDGDMAAFCASGDVANCTNAITQFGVACKIDDQGDSCVVDMAAFCASVDVANCTNAITQFGVACEINDQGDSCVEELQTLQATDGVFNGCVAINMSAAWEAWCSQLDREQCLADPECTEELQILPATDGDVFTRDGEKCIFPFRYNGKEFSTCSREGWTAVNGSWAAQLLTPWCSTEVDENGVHVTHKWGWVDVGCEDV